MRSRHPNEPRRLPEEQRGQLRGLLLRVEVDDRSPASLEALADYADTLRDIVPWWVASGRGDRIRLGDVEGGIRSLYRLVSIEDWGEAPRPDCPCARCRRRRRYGVHHTLAEAIRLGITGCDRGPRYSGAFAAVAAQWREGRGQ